jgi:PfaB family protein
MKPIKPANITQITNLAIIGMDCYLGVNCPDLQHLEEYIYRGEQGASFISADTVDFHINSVLTNKILEKAQIQPQSKIAIVVIANLNATIPQDLHHSTNTLVFKVETIFQALTLTQQILTTEQASVVLLQAFQDAINQEAVGVLLSLEQTAIKQSYCIYAIINGLVNTEDISQLKAELLKIDDIKLQDIGYLELINKNNQQVNSIISAHSHCPALNCALGGNPWGESVLISLVKTALSLHHSYIPTLSKSCIPKNLEIWDNSCFYLPRMSKPWFLEPGQHKRIAAILELNQTYTYIVVSEANKTVTNSATVQDNSLHKSKYLFPIAASDRSTLLEQINQLSEILGNQTDLATIAKDSYQKFQRHSQPKHILSILGSNHKELNQQIHHAIPGVNQALATQTPWQTPNGSYFTPEPLGKNSQLAFVYPGSFNSYIGIARDLFRSFPQIYHNPAISSLYHRVAKIDRVLYPRTIHELSPRELGKLEQELINHPLIMLEAEVGIAGLLTAILRDYFHIKPSCVFGYSLGEISMMFAQGVWQDFKYSSDALNNSLLFKNRIAGSKEAVREYWGLNSNLPNDFCSNYLLLCPLEQVQAAVDLEERVYITLINTPEEVIIFGETLACQRVIKKLNCHACAAHINHVIHCQPMVSEYQELVKINTFPVNCISETLFYSAADYNPISLESHCIAESIAQGLCKQLNFPELVNHIYNQNCKIFIEVGVGGNCSRWINKILSGKPHVAIPLNKRKTDDYTSIIKAIAQLLSHQVDVDLSILSKEPES